MTTIPYERTRRAALVAEPLTLERGQLTPTMKIVRRAVTEHHAALVDLLRSEASHPQILELQPQTGDAFHNA